MSTLYHYAAPVKSNTSRRFGAGIHRSLPTYHAPYTASDLDWLVADDARREANERALNAMLDEMAEEAEWLARAEMGPVL